MKKQLREILDILYEAEGLIELALSRDDSSVERIVPLVKAKCFSAADFASCLDVPETNHDNSVDKGDEPSDNTDAEQLFLEKVVPVLQTPDEPEFEPDHTPMISDSPQIEHTNDAVCSEAGSESITEVEEEKYEASETTDDTTDAAESETSDRCIGDEHLPESEDATEEAEESDEENEDLELLAGNEEFEDEEEASVIPAPVEHKPIAPFFSINDKYRFRRELFSNSNPQWLDSLALLETMADMEEAEDYLFNDLQWDPESLDVKAFTQVLNRYYSKR